MKTINSLVLTIPLVTLRPKAKLSIISLLVLLLTQAVNSQDYPIMRYIDDSPVPMLSDVARDKGYVVFRTNYLNMVMRETIPRTREIEQALTAFASLGEYEPVGFAIRTLRDLDKVSITATSLTGPEGVVIGSERIDIRSVRFHLQKLWRSDVRMMNSPVWLEKRDFLDIQADQTQPYWITFHVPENAKPGMYHGKLHVSVKDSESTDIELRLEVLPIRLDPLPGDFVFGMYDRVGRWGETDEELLVKFTDMKEHGMTSVGYFGNLGVDISLDENRVIIHFTGKSELERTVKAFQKAGLPGPFHWIMGKDIRDWAIEQAGSINSPEFGKYYRGVVEALISHGREEGWPEFIVQPEDEPFEYRHRWESMVRGVEALSPLTGIRIGEGGINANPAGLDEIFHLTDVFYFHDGPFTQRGIYDRAGWDKLFTRMKEENKLFWFYNVDHSGYHPEAGRFSYGYMVWDTEANGAFNWQYQSRRDNAYDTVTGNSYHFTFRYPPVGDEPGGPTTQWEAQREGIDDLRYLLTWRSLADRAKRQGDQDIINRVEEMEKSLDTWFDAIDYSKWTGGSVRGSWTTYAEDSPAFMGIYKIKGVWDFEQYNMIRRNIADWIIFLQKVQ